MFPPEPETGNSVLRAFKNAECFVRVTMTDEDDRLQVCISDIYFRPCSHAGSSVTDQSQCSCG